MKIRLTEADFDSLDDQSVDLQYVDPKNCPIYRHLKSLNLDARAVGPSMIRVGNLYYSSPNAGYDTVLESAICLRNGFIPPEIEIIGL